MVNGLAAPPPGDLMLWEDARDVAAWLVALRRAVPPNKWVDEEVEEARLNTFAGMM